MMKGVRTKRGKNTRLVYVRVGNKTFSVPAHRAKKFREAMGVPRVPRGSLTRNQWAANPHS